MTWADVVVVLGLDGFNWQPGLLRTRTYISITQAFQHLEPGEFWLNLASLVLGLLWGRSRQ